MKKRYIVIGLLASSLMALGQNADSTYRKQKISRTDIQVMMSFYTQDNDHSAVTGGIGTENLQVYASQVAIDHVTDSINTYHFDAGVDIISSASTDNIDFIKSSASKLDARTHANAGYQRSFNKKGITAGLNSGVSIESDYTSFGGGLNFSKQNASHSRQVSANVQAFFDDLRWGLLHHGHPIKLIYPSELRNTQWFDHYRRYSYNFEFGLFQVLNRRMTLGIYPGVAYQTGLLSTPFHRIYFSDKSERVETLPDHRLKIPIGIQLNTFVGGRWIVRTNYRYYWDDFGTVAHALNLEGVLKLKPTLSLTAMMRLYAQTASDYFKSYRIHDTDEAFYTSDYDLSMFTSFKPGISIRYAPYSGWKGMIYNTIELHYSYYHRSDGLNAHMATVYLNVSYQRPDKLRK
ncbi:MAG: DUF3570 domain-containing protein [Chryseolinea sp.]